MTFLRRHPVVCFFARAYVLAWGAIPWNSFFAPGALLAAVVVILLTEGLAGLRRVGRRLIRWHVHWVWYALALAVPLAVHVAAVSANVMIGAPPPDLGLLTPWYGLPLALGVHIIDPFGGPIVEEPSFRGYAQPELQRNHSPVAATAIMAVAISGWHAPLFLMPVFEAPPIGFLTTVAVTFWYAWLFGYASGSSLLTLIAHGVEGGVETNGLWSPGADLSRLHWTYAAAWCTVAVALLVADRRFWRGMHPSDSGSRLHSDPPATAPRG